MIVSGIPVSSFDGSDDFGPFQGGFSLDVIRSFDGGYLHNVVSCLSANRCHHVINATVGFFVRVSTGVYQPGSCEDRREYCKLRYTWDDFNISPL